MLIFIDVVKELFESVSIISFSNAHQPLLLYVQLYIRCINSLHAYLPLKPLLLVYLIAVIVIHEVAGNHHGLHSHLLFGDASLEGRAVAHTSLGDSAVHMEGSQVSLLEDGSLKH